MSTFVHEGRSGPWRCTITLIRNNEGIFSAVGDVVFQGRQRCKLVLCRPDVTTEAGVAILKSKCIDWIDEAERTPTPKTASLA
ncbi:hypothetical protein J2789_007093 [Variovorax paradoxus]|uniref:hypothetical protein n=1 Tax=Variovorax atrisoli TaxID=3394203 RepID=UPI00119A907A|nr:hypothetical protein [Variovorax paradoxus]MDR6524382.1 hypothetical protein [Variovorax paradoxus]